jgi:hypothetical protein
MDDEYAALVSVLQTDEESTLLLASIIFAAKPLSGKIAFALRSGLLDIKSTKAT